MSRALFPARQQDVDRTRAAVGGSCACKRRDVLDLAQPVVDDRLQHRTAGTRTQSLAVYDAHAMQATTQAMVQELPQRLLRRSLLDNGYTELPVTSQHAVSIDSLPALHRDPFDRMLLAQALTEGITLLTHDAQLSRYPGPVKKV